MNIGLSGGDGYLSKYLSKSLSNNFNIINFTSNQNLKNKYYQVENIDYDNLILLNKKFKNLDAFLHLSGPDVEFCNKNCEEALNFSTTITKKLINSMKDFGIKKFIFISSSKIYKDYININNKSPTIVNEESIIEPYDCYTKSKIAFEKTIHENFKNFDGKYYILRLSNTFGLYEQNSKSAFKLLLNSLFLEAFLKNQIKINSDKNFIRNYIYLEDLKNFIYLLLNKKNIPSGVLNVGSDQNLSLTDTSNKIISFFEKKKIIINQVKNFDDIQTDKLIFSNAKIKNIGYKSITNLEKNFEDMFFVLNNFFKIYK